MSNYEDGDSMYFEGLDVAIYRGIDGKLVVRIDGPMMDEDMLYDGSPDIRVWLNEGMVYDGAEEA